MPNDQPDANALGWALLTKSDRTAADLEAAISHFRDALAADAYAVAPMANLCDALVAAGREADAIGEAERAATPAAHNWLGWRWMRDAATLPRAIEHLRAAVRGQWRWGIARVNLGIALETAGLEDEAYEQFQIALASEGDCDRAYCHERLAAYQARRGWFRNALMHARGALREDDKAGGGERRAVHVEALAWIEAQLRAAGVEPPTPARERDERWQRACELELPPGFLERNELGQPLADEVIEVERRARDDRWPDVVRQLEQLRSTNYSLLFDAVGYAAAAVKRARAAGADDDALAIQTFVVEAYQYWASCSTSGGEGMARMVEVEREQAVLAELRAAAARPPASPAPAPCADDAHDLAAVATVSDSEVVQRCRRCARWWWATEQLDNHLEYRETKQLDAALAERAFVAHDVDALAQLLVQHDVPDGPFWRSATTVADALTTLAAGAAPVRVRNALAKARPQGRWAQVLAILEDRLAVVAVPPLRIDLDVPVPEGPYDGTYAVGDALVLLRPSPPSLVRIEARGVVALPFVGAPRGLAATTDRLLVAIPIDGSESVAVIDAAGQVTAWAPTPGVKHASPLDDGWWWIHADGDSWGEFHKPDGAPRAKVRFGSFDHVPRRMAAGWLVIDAIDDAGAAQALTLFDADFRMLAGSDGVAGARTPLLLADDVVWTRTDTTGPVWERVFTVERWQRDGRTLARSLELPAGAAVAVASQIVVLTRGGTLAARDLAGGVRWTRSVNGASELHAIGDRVVVVGAGHVEVLAASDGTVIAAYDDERVYAVASPDAVFVHAGLALLAVRADGPVARVLVGGAAFLARCGRDVAILLDGRWCTLVDSAGHVVGGIAADPASIYVARGAIYVAGGDRVRMHLRGNRW